MIGVENPLNVVTLSLCGRPLCLGNLYAPTCKHVPGSIHFAGLCGQRCHFALCRFWRHGMPIAGSLTPLQDEMLGRGKRKSSRGILEGFNWTVLRSGLCEWLSKMAARTHFMWESAEQISECTEGGGGRGGEPPWKAAVWRNVTVLKRD